MMNKDLEIQTTKNEIIFCFTDGQNKRTEVFLLKPDCSFRIKEIILSLIKEALSKQKSEFIELLEGVRMEELPLNKKESTSDWFWGFGWNSATKSINKRLDKIKEELR